MPNEMPRAREKKHLMISTRFKKRITNEEGQKLRWNQAVDKAANKFKWGDGVARKLKK